MHPNIFQKLLLLLPLAYQHSINGDDDSSANAEWNYDQNGADWEGTCATGLMQTPIKLSVGSSQTVPIPRIFFGNYDVKLKGPLRLYNKGYTVELAIPKTHNGRKPFITGGLLNGHYAADEVHFHWGSPVSHGSEHLINNRRYDMEMHIVHRNMHYRNIAEAVNYVDGIAVLGIMFKIAKTSDRVYPGLRKIFAELPKVVEYQDVVSLPGSITLGQLLGDLNTHYFYTYKGSLTTPGCNEPVTWTVFAQPLPIALSDASKFWQLKDPNENLVRNNYRELQPRNNRPVFYRINTNHNRHHHS